MSAPAPDTVKTPFAYDADPATPTEPTSCVSQGLGTDPPGGGVTVPAVVNDCGELAATSAGLREVALVRDTTLQ